MLAIMKSTAVTLNTQSSSNETPKTRIETGVRASLLANLLITNDIFASKLAPAG
jgi:hypothetical protein